MQERFLGFYCNTGLEPSFQGLASQFAMPRMFSLDRNISVTETQLPVRDWYEIRFYKSTEDLLSFVRKYEVVDPEWYVVSVLVESHSSEIPEHWAQDPVDAKSIPSDMTRFLGYDVCCGYMLSGLLNMGGAQEHLSKWRGNLNDHCLFVDLSDAIDFSRECDMYASEHAPFYVFGIYGASIDSL